MLTPDGQSVDGFVSSQEIRFSGINADLVVLSACETALGQEVKSEGLVGLSHSFLQSGAKGVLGTLWPVSDRSSADFMPIFYDKLYNEKLSVVDALKKAQIDYASKFRSDPHYWAAYVYQGRHDSRPFGGQAKGEE